MYVKSMKKRVLAGALVTIALLVLNQLLIQYSLHEQKNGLAFLNKLGRQHMLSERIATGFYETSKGEASIGELEKVVREWETSQAALLSEITALKDLPLSYSGWDKLEAEIKAMAPYFAVVNDEIASYKNTNEVNPRRIAVSQHDFAAKLDRLLPAFATAFNKNVTRIVIVEVLLATCTFVIIFIALRYIYFPQARRLEQSVTDLERQEQELEMSKSLYNTLQSLQDYAFILLNPQGIIRTWNPGAEKIKGYAAEEIIGKSFEVFYTDKDMLRGRPSELLATAAKQGTAKEEGWRKRKDGSLFWANVLIAAIRDKDGNLVGFSKLTGDISSHKIPAEMADKVPVLLAYWDMTLKCRYANKHYLDWFGKRPEEVINKASLPDLLGPIYEQNYQYINAALKGRAQEFEIDLVRPSSGEKFRCLANYYPDVEDGEVKGFIAQVADISHLKQLEAERLERARLEAKNTELESFAYIASHDLQEPLRTISNYIQIIKEDHGDKLEGSILDYCNFIEGATKRMKELVRVLLDHSRIGKDRKLALCNAESIVTDVLGDMNELITTTGATIHHEKLPTFLGFETELRQLFQNLLSNAIKFRKPGLPPSINISCEENKENYCFSISDNGIGIEERHYQRIFQIFQRLHGPQKYEGHGIGLANCQKIAELHGGKIWVKSEVGVGSVFSFTIEKFRIKSNDKQA